MIRMRCDEYLVVVREKSHHIAGRRRIAATMAFGSGGGSSSSSGSGSTYNGYPIHDYRTPESKRREREKDTIHHTKAILTPMRILILAVLGCLIFCFFLVHNHVDQIHMGDSIGGIAGGRGPVRTRENYSKQIHSTSLSSIEVGNGSNDDMGRDSIDGSNSNGSGGEKWRSKSHRDQDDDHHLHRIQPNPTKYPLLSGLASENAEEEEAQGVAPTPSPLHWSILANMYRMKDGFVSSTSSSLSTDIVGSSLSASSESSGDRASEFRQPKLTSNACKKIESSLNYRSESSLFHHASQIHKTSYSLLRRFDTNDFSHEDRVKQGKEDINSKESVQKRVQDFHRVLRSGDICMISDDKYHQSSNNKDDPGMSTQLTNNNLYDLMQKLIFAQEYTSVLEFTTTADPMSSVSQYLAEKHYHGYGPYEMKGAETATAGDGKKGAEPTTFLLLGHSSSTSTNNVINCQPRQVPNLLVSSQSITPSLLEGKFNCLQYISDLSLFSGDLLPYEFELALGKTLCRCNDTLVEKTLPDHSFFSYWESIEVLVTAAVKAVAATDVGCNIEINNESRGALMPSSTSTSSSTSSTSRSRYKGYVSSAALSKGFSSSLKMSRYMLLTRSSNLNQSTYDGYLPLKQLLELNMDLPSTQFISQALLEVPYHVSKMVYNDLLLRGDMVVSKYDHSRIKKEIEASVSLLDVIRSHPSSSSSSSSSSSLPLTTASHYSSSSSSSSSHSWSHGSPHSSPSLSSTSPPSHVTSREATNSTNSAMTPVATSLSSSLSSQSSSGDTSDANITSSDTTTSEVRSSSHNVHSGTFNSGSYNRYLSKLRSQSHRDSNGNDVSNYDQVRSNAVDRKSEEDLHDGKKNVLYRRRLYASSRIQNKFVVERSDITTKSLRGAWTGVELEVDKAHDPFVAVDEAIAHNKSYHDMLFAVAHVSPSSNISSSIPSSNDGMHNRNSAWMNSLARIQQNALRARENDAYLLWKEVLSSPASASTVDTLMDIAKTARLIYAFGNKISQLSTFLCSLQTRHYNDNNYESYEKNSVGLTVSVLSDSLAIAAHEQLLNVMSVHNNIPCQSELYLPQLSALTTAPELAELSIIQVNVFIRLLGIVESKEMLVEALQALLSLSLTTIIELPSKEGLSRLTAVQRYMSLGSNYENFIESYDACTMLQLVAKTIAIPSSMTSIKSSIAEMSVHEITVDSNEWATRYFRVEFNFGDKHHQNNPRGKGSVSVQTLLTLGLTKTPRRALMKLFLDLPLHKACKHSSDILHPSNLYVDIQDHSIVREKFLEYDVDTTSALSLWFDPSCDIGELKESTKMKSLIGSTSGWGSLIADRVRAVAVWQSLHSHLKKYPEDLADGKFSILDHKSGYGHLSALIAQAYPVATVISVEREEVAVDYHVRMLDAMNISNNAVCMLSQQTETKVFLTNLYESPEFFRFQILLNDVMQQFAESNDMEEWGSKIGYLMSTAMSSFINVPSDAHLSLAMKLFYDTTSNRILKPVKGDRIGWLQFDSTRGTYLQYSLISHPSPEYAGFEKALLLAFAKTPEYSSTEVVCSEIDHDQSRKIDHMHILRCDVHNMTRHVHHHFDYKKDGHKRTYTMKVIENRTATDEKQKEIKSYIQSGGNQYPLAIGNHPNRGKVIHVALERDKDSFQIPYTSIYGVTLIATLRMGLDSRLREKLFGEFLDLSLYEDMAPWNIVLNGPTLAYIDYDTRERTFDKEVSKAYQLLSILMNYKRTVEDFKRCGPKAGTVYNLPFISDCVGGKDAKGMHVECPDLALPVPCGDGTCHSDYISCLHSLANTVQHFVDKHASRSPFFSPSSSSSSSPGTHDPETMESFNTKNHFNDVSQMVFNFNDKGLVY